MTQKRLVITGATGHIGSKVVPALLAQGHHVVAVARASERLDALQQAGAEPAAGAVHDVDFLTRTLRGADAAFLLVPTDGRAADVLADTRRGGEALAQAVQAAGLRQAVNLSSTRVNVPVGSGPLFVAQEACLNAIEGLAMAHLRPAYFMENLLANVPMILRSGAVASPARPDVAFPMIATRDIAAKVAELLGGDPLQDHPDYHLLGPRAYSMQEATAALGQAIGRPELPYQQLSYEAARAGALKAGLSASMADLFEALNRSTNETDEMRVERTPEATTPTTIEEFARTVFAPAFQQATGANGPHADN